MGVHTTIPRCPEEDSERMEEGPATAPPPPWQLQPHSWNPAREEQGIESQSPQGRLSQGLQGLVPSPSAEESPGPGRRCSLRPHGGGVESSCAPHLGSANEAQPRRLGLLLPTLARTGHGIQAREPLGLISPHLNTSNWTLDSRY